MRTKGNQELIRGIIAQHGLKIEKAKITGNFTSYRLRRVAPALRIVPPGDSYYFTGIEYHGKKGYRYSFQNVHYSNHVIDKKAPNTTILGNMAWFDIITAVLETGARVDVLGQKFESVAQYHDFVESCVLFDLVEAEREMNKKGGRK